MATINFLYRSTKEQAPLVLRLLFRVNDKDYVFGTKTRLIVSKKYWRKEHKLKRIKDVDVLNYQASVNSELSKIKNFILTAFNSYDRLPNKLWLYQKVEEFYNPKQELKIPNRLLDYIQYYISIRENELSANSIKKINVVKRKIERFEVFRGNIPIMIKEINLNFKKEFENYLLSVNYAPNTIARDIRYIKTFCNHAKYNGIETHYQLEKVQSKYLKVTNIYLTTKEINSIENLTSDKLSEHLDSIRDWLLISCYTGQRISDFLRFSKEMIRYEDNKPLLEFTQKKTGKIMTIPLSSKVIKILEKRNGKFPNKISDQKYNKRIKDVCEIALIKQKVKGFRKKETSKDSGVFRNKAGLYPKYKLVTSHIGRRSFATNNYGKIPTSFLKYNSGHSTESLFLEYIGKSNKDIALELSNYLE